MNKSDVRKGIRVLSGVICALLLAVTLFSVSYIAMEAGHRCECEECPICACIEICEAAINQVGSAFAVIIVAVLGLLSFISSSDTVICHIIRQTPVTYKIRMNN